MAHWAELDENNVVIRVLVGSNDDPDEGYQWLIDNLGGRWLKTSYNTWAGKHTLGGIPLRGNYAGIGFTYHEDVDAFMPLKEYPSWIIDAENYTWKAPVDRPDSGAWAWNEELLAWEEIESE